MLIMSSTKTPQNQFFNINTTFNFHFATFKLFSLFLFWIRTTLMNNSSVFFSFHICPYCYMTFLNLIDKNVFHVLGYSDCNKLRMILFRCWTREDPPPPPLDGPVWWPLNLAIGTPATTPLISPVFNTDTSTIY